MLVKSMKVFGLILALALAALLIQPSFLLTSASTLTLVVSTEKLNYSAGDQVNIAGNLTLDGSPVQDALVALEIVNNYGSYLFRTVPTGEILNPSWTLEITNVYSCNQHGEPVSSFSRGSNPYVKVEWRNNSPFSQFVVVALYVQFSTGTPFYAFTPSRGETPGNNSSYIITQLPTIPSYAPSGVTTIYASLFTENPKDGGVPYCPERIATFTITGTSGLTLLRPSTSSTSSFSLAFILTRNDLILGNYVLYATTYYQQFATDLTIFQVILLGDINGDLKVDMIDVGLCSKAYGSKPGDPKWDARADLNGDGRVDMKDVGIVCKAYGSNGIL